LNTVRKGVIFLFDGKMKVLRGMLKNRPILVPGGTRPVSMRVKKSLFDLISSEIKGKRVLDLFAGSGGLGVEALSCGAEMATFIEIRKSAVEVINKNLSSLHLTMKGRVYWKDVFKSIKDFWKKGVKFDFIFLDPPYYKGMTRKVLKMLDEYDILTFLGYVVCLGYYKDEEGEEIYRNFSLIRKKRYGQTVVLIYRKDECCNISGNI